MLIEAVSFYERCAQSGRISMRDDQLSANRDDVFSPSTNCEKHLIVCVCVYCRLSKVYDDDICWAKCVGLC